jgi:thioredoxin reductase (NADPH)
VSPARPELIVIGRRLESVDHRLRDYLTRIAQPFRWIEADAEAAVEALARHGLSAADLPVVIEADGTVTRKASIESLAAAWRLNAELDDRYDLVIVGAGPAGLSSAVYAASDGLKTLVVDADVPGGQASHTSLIENFFGFPDGIGGAELARLAGRQAERFGAHLELLTAVVGSRIEDGAFFVELASGGEIEAPVLIAAPGMDWRRLEVAGIDELLGRGVYYGAGRSEAAQCGGDPVIVVGAGNSAGQAVMHLADAAANVTMLVRGDDLGKSMSGYLVDRIKSHPLIDVRLRTEVDAIGSEDGVLSEVTIRDTAGGRETLAARALFLCLGGTPRTGWADDVGVRVDRAGYILTGPDLLDAGKRPAGWPLDRDPLALETSVPGLFAAGDVRHGSAKRVAGAAGDGATAVALVHRRLEELRAGQPGAAHV